MTRALLITNPAAARTDARAVTAIRETLRAGGWAVEVLATAGPGDARRFAGEAQAQGFDVVLSYGGDGTAMQVAAGLAGTGIPLGIVPGGTGNILAGNLRLARNPTRAARNVLRGVPYPLDLGIVNRIDGDHYYAVCAGAGVDAEVMAATGPALKRRLKTGAYVLRGLAALPGVHNARHRIEVDGVAHEVDAAMVLIVNCGELLPPFVNLGPTVRPNDGWLDVVALRANGVLESFSALWAMLRGVSRVVPGGRLWVARGRRVRVDVVGGPARPVQLDGEVAGMTPFEARILSHALTVLVDPATVPGGVIPHA